MPRPSKPAPVRVPSIGPKTQTRSLPPSDAEVKHAPLEVPFSGKALDGIEPRGRGRHEMAHPVRMPLQPRHDLGGPVDAVKGLHRG